VSCHVRLEAVAAQKAAEEVKQKADEEAAAAAKKAEEEAAAAKKAEEGMRRTVHDDTLHYCCHLTDRILSCAFRSRCCREGRRRGGYEGCRGQKGGRGRYAENGVSLESALLS
jgi:hypothetical protein